jgi:Uma2 family endonuclease
MPGAARSSRRSKPSAPEFASARPRRRSRRGHDGLAKTELGRIIVVVSPPQPSIAKERLPDMRSERPPKLQLRQLLGHEVASHELIGSRVVPIEAPSAAHALLVARVQDVLGRQLVGRPWRVVRDAQVRAGDAHVLRPDVMVAFRAPGESAGAALDPAIVVEVMSPTTAVRDRGAKRLGYFQLADLQHYVLVSSSQYSLEIFSRQSCGEWSYRNYSDDLSRVVELPGFDIYLHLVAIYEGIDLDEQERQDE